MNAAVVLDINETVLDLSALDPLFATWFGDDTTRSAWFAHTLHLAMILAATRDYRAFSEVGAAALSAIARRHDVSLPAGAANQLQTALRHLPPHADVVPALVLLRGAGLRIVALSNNSLITLHKQLRHAEILHLFDEIISVDEAGALKPSPDVYHYTAHRLRLTPSSLWMVAAHGWDIAGAMGSGFHGAFVARPGQEPNPFVRPEIIAPDLLVAARTIIESQT